MFPTADEWLETVQAFKVQMPNMVRSGRSGSFRQASELAKQISKKYYCVTTVEYVGGGIWCTYHDPSDTVRPVSDEAEDDRGYEEPRESNEEYQNRLVQEENDRAKQEIDEELTCITMSQARSDETGWYYDDDDD